ncbi:MAG: polymer-forming cytoskeletal protein [Gammaproteobacteria bacterium]
MNSSVDKRRLRDRASQSATIVAAGTVFTGTVSGDAGCIVYGRIEGDCRLEATVVVERGGSWHGRIDARNVIVAGEVEGEIHARERLELAASAGIRGNVRGASISIAEGAVCDGEVQTTAGNGEPMHFRDRRGAGA